jgi:hypothetical protein
MKSTLRLLTFTLFTATLAPAAQLIVNGGFESGFSSWSRLDAAGSDGTFQLQSGTSSPANGITVPAPPGPTIAAMTDSQGPGSHVLYQDIVVPGSGSWTFSVSLFLGNRATAYSTPATLAFDTPTLNQQFRVDLIKTSADLFSVAAADVLQNLYQTHVGDPLVSGYFTVTSNLTTLFQANAGQTIRLRFAEVDNVNLFEAGVDNVSVSDAAAVPEPSTLWAGFVLAGLMAVQLIRRRHAV